MLTAFPLYYVYLTQWDESAKELKICQIILPSVFKNSTYHCRKESGNATRGHGFSKLLSSTLFCL